MQRFTLLVLMLVFGLVFGLPTEGASIEAQALDGVPQVVQDALRAGGANASGWGFYNCDQYNPNFFNDQFDDVRATGAGHVRLLISMCALEQGTTGQVRDDRFNDLVRFIRRAHDNGLLVNVDIHNIYFKKPGSGDWNEDYMLGLADPAVAKRHLDLMVDLAGRLGRTLDTTWFVIQPANEPIYVWSDAARHKSVWYEHQARLLPAMRAACATCTIYATSHDWQGIEAMLYSLRTPFADRNLVYDVHFYEPMNVSHCGGFDGRSANCSGTTWPGRFETWRGTEQWNRAKIESLLRPLEQWSERYGVFINVSEFGVTTWSPEHVRMAYLRDLVNLFREYGWGYTVYDWNSNNFGVAKSAAILGVVFPQPNEHPVTPTVVPPTQTPTSTPTQTPTSTPTAVPPTPTPTPTDIPTGGNDEAKTFRIEGRLYFCLIVTTEAVLACES